MFEMWNKNPNFDLSITAKATKTKPNDNTRNNQKNRSHNKIGF